MDIGFIAWVGQGDGVSLLLGGILLLLMVGVTLIMLPQIGETAVDTPSIPLAFLPLWLTSFAALPALFADSPQSLLTGWTLFMFVSLSRIFWIRDKKELNPTSIIGRFAIIYTLLWGAAILAPVHWEQVNSPQAVTLLFTAAFILIGVQKRIEWATFEGVKRSWETAVSTLIGGVILARLAGTGASPTLFTLLAMIGLLYAVYKAWSPDADAKQAGIRLAIAAMLGQTAVWGTTTAVLADIRLLVLAAPLLSIAIEHSKPNTRHKMPFIFAIMAFIGVPMLGFTGQTTLYGAWLTNGNYLLIIITALLHLLLIAALLDAALRPSNEDETAPVSNSNTPITIGWDDIGRGLLAAGLFSFQVSAWMEAGISSLLIILISFAGGGALFYYMGTKPAWLIELPATIAQAFAPTDKVKSSVRDGGWIVTAVLNAVDEAVNILEGKTGLLWLLAIGLLILLMQ